ncbi:MAG: hypothetical protein ACQEW8_14010 [Actinomycetota bacterium]
MTEPQTWVVIGVFTTAMLGGMTLMSAQFSRVLRAEIGRLEAKLDSLDARVTARLDALDRDVAALTRHVWRDGEWPEPPR